MAWSQKKCASGDVHPYGCRCEALERRHLLASATFTYDPPVGTQNPQSLRFDLDIATVPGGATLALTNMTTGQPITDATMTSSSWSGGASAIFTFPTYTNGVVSSVL